MSDISKNTEAIFTLDGVRYEGLIELHDVTIQANYQNDNVQPSITVEDFTFTDESKEVLVQHIEDGLTGGVGIFEGMPFNITLFNNQPQQANFKSYIDFTNGYRELLQDGRVDVSTIKDDGIDNFFDQLGATTYAYLESIGAITTSDYGTINYVVEKKFNLVEILTTSIVLYMMIKELAEAIERTANAIADVLSLSIASITSAPAAAILAVLKALIAVAYTTILLLTIINLATTLINTLVPPKRMHKIMTVQRLLEVVCEHFGYTLNAPIDELKYLVYNPSNPRMDDKTLLGFIDKTHGTPVGIPNVQDYGYYCAEMFDMVKNLFYAKISITNKVVNIIPRISNYWLLKSTYNLPDVEIQQKQYNTDELNATRLLNFEVDINDEWTIDQYIGTSYEIKTSPITVTNKNAVLLKGLDEVNMRVALGNRKDKLNAIENLLVVVGGAIDTVTGVFGGGTNFAGKIKSKVGVLKVSNNWTTQPKLLYIKNNKLPTNHRSLFSAQTLYDNYHIDGSFVANNGIGQKVVYNDVVIPFGFEDYKVLTNNSYFKYNGADAKITSFNWTIGMDKAKVSFWVRSRYTKNLRETFINPS